jgi:hypothetical protein
MRNDYIEDLHSLCVLQSFTSLTSKVKCDREASHKLTLLVELSIWQSNNAKA